MVSDVRQKIGMRLAAMVTSLVHDINADSGARLLIMAAQSDPSAAALVRARYRTRVVQEFPGCQITFTRQNIAVKMPTLYPRSENPILQPLPPILVEAFHPRGYLEPSKEG